MLPPSCGMNINAVNSRPAACHRAAKTSRSSPCETNTRSSSVARLSNCSSLASRVPSSWLTTTSRLRLRKLCVMRRANMNIHVECQSHQAGSASFFLRSNSSRDKASAVLPDRLLFAVCSSFRSAHHSDHKNTSAPSWISIARRVLPSRLELKRPAGSLSEAPLAKVSFTTFL